VRKKNLYGILLVIFLGLASEALIQGEWLRLAEDWYYNLWHQQSGVLQTMGPDDEPEVKPAAPLSGEAQKNHGGRESLSEL
jgi:hypothetical protein